MGKSIANQPRGTAVESDVRRPSIARINGLDGLRAIAVLAVLAYHLYAPLLPGGFLGVDVFFVVSGFLITTLLLREHSTTGRLALKQFWVRRARRLLPALLLVVVGSTALGFLIGRDLLVGIGRQALGALTFSNNWIEIAAGSSYFAQTSPALFVNFWSLAVEEQFYLLWPFGFLLLMRWAANRRTRIRIALGLAVASAVAMALLYVPGTDSTRVYYGTDTHAFGLMIGVALAFAWSNGTGLDLGRANWRQRRGYVGSAALVGLIGCMFLMDAASWFTYRGGIFLACVLTAIVILTLLEGAGPLQSAMNHRSLVWVGQRSYGIYLWHWPALVISDALLPQAIGSPAWWTTRIIALVLTLAVSAVSYRWVEEPVRKQGFAAIATAVAAALRRGGRARLNGAKLVVAFSGILVLLAGAGIATAPDKSQVQAALERNQSLVSDRTPQRDAGANAAPTRAQPSASGSASASASAPASASASADPSPTASAKPSSARSPASSTAAGVAMDYPAGNEIMAVGDSLVVTSADGLLDRFPGMSFDAESNRQWPDGVAAVHARIDDGSMTRAVIVHFGTNAGVPDPALVTDVLDTLGKDRMVVVVNLYGASEWVPSANDALAAAAKGRPNVIIADWNKAISKRPDLLQPDQIHPGILGAHLYADTIKAAFHALAVRSGGTVPPDYAIVADY